ncbi:MAG: histidine kinase, partial [Candidatus Aminicenantes bacterium]|nr:histidine kinase [Candidatus Aminicenantes bacterium]
MKNKDFFISSIFIIFMWLVYLIIQAFVYIFKSPDLLNYIIGSGIYKLIVFSIFTIALFYLFKKYFYNKFLNKKKILILVLGLLVSSCIINIFIGIYTYFYFHKFNLTFGGFILGSAMNIFTLVPFLGLFFVLKLLKEKDDEKLKTEEAKNLAREAKLEMLSYQLNPHFLFNALNTIMALIDHDKEEAREIITDLSDYLRYSLNNSKKKEVSLEEEYISVLDYLKIQKKRFREKIEIKTELDENIKKIKVPVFIIHPLVENAVKHGTETCKGVLKISLTIKNVEDSIIVEVKNSGKIIKNSENSDNGTGTGLSNTIKRISLL